MFCWSAAINARAAAVFSLGLVLSSIRIFPSDLTITPRIASGIGHRSFKARSHSRVSRINQNTNSTENSDPPLTIRLTIEGYFALSLAMQSFSIFCVL